MQLLDDITIVDFSRLLPGPLATDLLQQLGATVHKIEHPTKGDYTKMQPPMVKGQSTLYQALNGNKQVHQIDYLQPEGRQQVLSMVAEADILVEQFRPGVMEQWGLGYQAVKAAKADIIYVSLSGYGQTGPYAQTAGHDLNYLALSGILGLTTAPNGQPVIPGVQVADISSGSYMTVNACLAGLYHRQRTGKGSYHDVSMFDGLLPLLTIPATMQWGGVNPAEARFLAGDLVNYNVYKTSDGQWVALAALEMKFWNNFCQATGHPDWQRQHQLQLSTKVFPHHEVVALFASKTLHEWLALAQQSDMCLSPVQLPHQVQTDPHVAARHNVVHRQTTEAQQQPQRFCYPVKMTLNT